MKILNLDYVLCIYGFVVIVCMIFNIFLSDTLPPLPFVSNTINNGNSVHISSTTTAEVWDDLDF